MSICRKHPHALNDGDCIDCLREELWELKNKSEWIEVRNADGADWVMKSEAEAKLSILRDRVKNLTKKEIIKEEYRPLNPDAE